MLKQSDLRNFFCKRNAETDQEPSSSGCSESDQSKSSKKTSPPKKSENFLSSWLGRYKWLRCENDLMFCDICLTAKACSNPFTEGFTTSQNFYAYIKRWNPHFQWWDPHHNQSWVPGTPKHSTWCKTLDIVLKSEGTISHKHFLTLFLQQHISFLKNRRTHLTWCSFHDLFAVLLESLFFADKHGCALWFGSSKFQPSLGNIACDKTL